jgi:DNA (cytosine-5)-methyltransferase 1
VPLICPALKARDYKGPSSDGDGDGASLVPVAFKSKQAENFHAVAFTQNQREEVRELNDCATTLNLQGTHQQGYVATPFDTTQITSKANYSRPQPGDPCHPIAAGSHPPAVAFSERTRDHGSHLELESTDVTPAIRTGVNRQQGVIHSQGFTYSGYSNQPAWMTGDRTDCLPSSGHSDGSHQGVGVIVFDGGNQSTSYDIHHTLRIGRDSGDAVYFEENFTAVRETQVAPAITTNGYKISQNAGGLCLRTAMSVRRLTPRECERLQGFPDDYTLVTYRNKPAADGPRYKALGNSMAVPVMRWIGERIASVDSLNGAT